MIIRRYILGDCSELDNLFYDTVHSINSKDYSKQQLDVWVTGKANLEDWNNSFFKHFTVVSLKMI